MGESSHVTKLDQQMSEQAEQQKLSNPIRCIVIRGLPNSGKTTLANKIVDKLRAGGYPVFHINADTVRSSLNSDLGFDPHSRVENARRIGAVAFLAQVNGMIPVVDFVMPTEETRNSFRMGFQGNPFSLLCVNREPGFKSRFADTVKMFEGPLGANLSYSLSQIDNVVAQIVNCAKKGVNSESCPWEIYP